MGVTAQTATYQPFYDASTINMPALDANPIVGTINGADNSGNGTAGCTIPIEIPKGTNGMEPSVSVSYNSGLKNGILGYGTSLNAICAIIRGSKSLYYDGKFDKINGNIDDAFYTDGQRLIKVSNKIVGTNIEYLYVPEQFSQINITAVVNNASPNEIQYWRVNGSDGSVIEYGNGGNSRLLGEIGSPSILAWRINKRMDVFGNYLTYTYINTGNTRDYRLSEINYTGNATQGLTPYNKIAFSYVLRTDKNKLYMAGASICTDYLLDKIEVTTEGNAMYRTNQFSYAFNGQYCFLRDITFIGIDGVTALNKTKLKYFGASVENTETVTNINCLIETLGDDVKLIILDGNITEAVDVQGTILNYQQTFDYYSNDDRVKSELTIAGTNNRIRYYLGDYEEQQEGGGITQIAYISTPVGLSVMEVNTNGQSTTNYVYTDHLGSLAVVTDDAANIIAKQSYDAWGRPRCADDWTYTTTPNITNPNWLWRGYTGHEMMTEFALINMNARLYDYVNGRMLQPDVAISGGTQGLNRYSYARNNPMKFTDPSGNNPLLIAALIGGCANVLMNLNNIHNLHSALGYFAIGAVGGLLGAGIGGAITGVGFYINAASGFFAGFGAGMFTGTANALMQGKSGYDALYAGMKSGTIGALLGGISNGIRGAIVAKNAHGNIWTGEGSTSVSYSNDIQQPYQSLDDPIEYSTAQAECYKQAWGFDRVEYKVIADGSMPNSTAYETYYVDCETQGLMVTNKSGTFQVNGVTTYIDGVQNVYLYKPCFVSREMLFITLKHEYTHVVLNSLGYLEAGEGNAYFVQSVQEKKWGYDNSFADRMVAISRTTNQFINHFDYFKYNLQPITRPWLINKP